MTSTTRERDARLCRDRLFEPSSDLDVRLAALRSLPYFRPASPAEVDASFSSYAAGDIPGLIASWQRVAAPTRAELPGPMGWAYERAGRGPRMFNALVFLITIRAVLRAGERFRATLGPEVSHVIHHEFPWLERRHEHVPPGYTPAFEFPDVFREFLEVPDLDDARARWQLAVALNEVQQCWYSEHAATLFRLPELRRHAERERALALDYFARWSPRCTKELWHETIAVLDALNAAVFELVCRPHGVFAYALQGIVTQRGQWRAFVTGLDTPQWLLSNPPVANARLPPK